jgi:LysM repeat protein
VASLDIRAIAEGGCPLRFAVAEVDGPEGEPFTVERPGNGLVLVNVAQETPEAEEEPTEATPAQVPAGGDGVYHIVQAGETIFGIAQQYGTTVDAIVEANGLEDPDAVRVGERLLIPPAESSVGPGDRTTTYVVRPGDTLSSIAVRYGTTVEALADLNGLTPPYDIIAGETLRIR